MSVAFMRKNRKIKVPKEVCRHLKLNEGDRVVFFWSEPRKTYAIFPRNVDPKDVRACIPTSELRCTPEERDTLLNFHRGRDLSKEESETVLRVLKARFEEEHGPLTIGLCGPVRALEPAQQASEEASA